MYIHLTIIYFFDDRLKRQQVAPDDSENADRQEGVFRLYPEYDFYRIANPHFPALRSGPTADPGASRQK